MVPAVVAIVLVWASVTKMPAATRLAPMSAKSTGPATDPAPRRMPQRMPAAKTIIAGPEDDELEDLQPTELTPAQLADEVRHRVVRGVHEAVDEEDQDKEWRSDGTGEEREAGLCGAAGSH